MTENISSDLIMSEFIDKNYFNAFVVKILFSDVALT